MRDLERDYRISARSIAEVIGPLEQAVSRLGTSRVVKFRGRKLSVEAFLNAALLHLLSQPEADQEAAIAAGLGRLETILAADPAPPPGVVPAPRTPRHGHPVDPATGDRLDPKARRKGKAG